MHDPDERRDEPGETWDEWFGRTHARRTPGGWRFVLLVAAVAIVSLYWISVARGG